MITGVFRIMEAKKTERPRLECLLVIRTRVSGKEDAAGEMAMN